MDLASKTYQRWALIAGGLAGIATIAALFFVNLTVFFQFYLVAYMFWFDLTAGGFILAMLHYLTGGDWGFAVRRNLEASAKNMWLMAILFIPILLGLAYLYPWVGAGTSFGENAYIGFRHTYLSVPFFIGRAVVYFALWLFMLTLLTRWAPDPSYTFGPQNRGRFQAASALGLIIFIITMSFASADWLMSLQPEWFSTAFGLLILTGQTMGGLAFAILVLTQVSGERPLAKYLTPRVIRDVGAILLTAVMSWAYIAFSQLLIIWSGNLPRETVWYIDRIQDGWQWVGIAVVALQFGVPFLVLISLRAKQSPLILAGLSIIILVTRLLDYYWQIVPAFFPTGLYVHWVVLFELVAIGGFWLAAYLWNFNRTPLVLPSLPPLPKTSDTIP